MNENITTSNRISTKTLVLIALMTAITCILAPLSIPIPISPVPITLTNLVLYFSIYLLGWKKATISYIVYLLLGIVGLPVFSGFSGGLGKAFGPTGGYLIGFLFITVISGIFIEKFQKNIWLCILGMVLGLAICYIIGTFWLAGQLDMTFVAALGVGVLPYLLGDAVKIALAALIAPQIKKRVNALS
ncbi:MAG: biotin transporter BioY [Hespellia sp.]|nr:biotin transporter BioY [Hespellia sp.]